jgi:hypothetical protein
MVDEPQRAQRSRRRRGFVCSASSAVTRCSWHGVRRRSGRPDGPRWRGRRAQKRSGRLRSRTAAVTNRPVPRVFPAFCRAWSGMRFDSGGIVAPHQRDASLQAGAGIARVPSVVPRCGAAHFLPANSSLSHFLTSHFCPITSLLQHFITSRGDFDDHRGHIVVRRCSRREIVKGGKNRVDEIARRLPAVRRHDGLQPCRAKFPSS